MAYQAQAPESSLDSDYYNRTKSFFADAVSRPKPEFGAKMYPATERGHDDRIMADPAIAAAVPKHLQPPRTMFVTIGSIASFKPLIKEVVSREFLETLSNLKYHRLIVQCGPDLDYFEEIRPQKGFDSCWVDIIGFDWTKDIKSYFLQCTPSDGKNGTEKRGIGIIMAHAGAGTMLDALKVNSRVVVVPNTSLMDNHQVELADEFDRQGYVLRADTGKLSQAVERLETWQPENWPPKRPDESKLGHLGELADSMVPSSERTEHGYGSFQLSGRFSDSMVLDWRKTQAGKKSG